MSSLLAMAKKGKINLVCQDTHGANALDRRSASRYIEKILHRDTIHIRAQNILIALMEHEEAPGFRSFEDITPPFAWTWVEARLTNESGVGFRIGCLTHRCNADERDALYRTIVESSRKLGNLASEGPHRHYLTMIAFIESDGVIVGPASFAGVVTDEYGQAQGWSISPMNNDELTTELSVELQTHCCCLAMESFVWMNTQGTELVQAKEAKIRSSRHRDIPACVWHEIVVRPNRVLLGGKSAFQDEAEQRREHWVRAHRADYRKGAGLFGRIKQLIWVPEHKRGNPELGCLIPEYRFEGKTK